MTTPVYVRWLIESCCVATNDKRPCETTHPIAIDRQLNLSFSSAHLSLCLHFSSPPPAERRRRQTIRYYTSSTCGTFPSCTPPGSHYLNIEQLTNPNSDPNSNLLSSCFTFKGQWSPRGGRSGEMSESRLICPLRGSVTARPSGSAPSLGVRSGGTVDSV